MGETTELAELGHDRVFIRRGPFRLPQDDRVSELPVPVPTDETEEGSTDYFTCYFSYISSLGCVPPMPDVRSKKKRFFQWAAFIIITFIAGLQSLSSIKWRLLGKNTKLKYVIYAGYTLNKALLKATFVYVVCFRREELKKLIIRIRNSGRVFRGCFDRKKVRIICKILLVSIVIKTIAEGITHHQSVQDWDLREAVLQRSYEFGYFLYVWKPNTDNETQEHQDQINDLYGTEINPTTISFAATQITIMTVGRTFEKVIYILFTAALTLNCLTCFLQKELVQDREIDNALQPTLPTNVWLMYKEIKEISAGFNDIFGDYFYLIHVDNFLFGSLILYEVTHGNMDIESLFFLAFEVAIYSNTFGRAAKSSGTNLVLRNWLQRNFSHVVSVWLESENRPLVISALMDELQTYPLGLTINNTPMDSAFLARFVGTMISNYILLVGATDDAMSNT